MTRLAIIHTTPATVEPLKALAAQVLPGWGVVNFVDDSILPQLAENGGDVSQVEARLVTYARFAAEVGADVILEACSSVGEVVEKMQEAVDVPVVRIDEAMAEVAVAEAGVSAGGRPARIGVAATLATTLEPTMRLLRQKAGAAGVRVELVPELVAAAYRRLADGDREGHDTVLAEALAGLAGRADVIVLAQASMARVLPRLPHKLQAKFWSSPGLALQRVSEAYQKQRAREAQDG
jgi:Asp/Glu/hydantoin racemase